MRATGISVRARIGGNAAVVRAEIRVGGRDRGAAGAGDRGGVDRPAGGAGSAACSGEGMPATNRAAGTGDGWPARSRNSVGRAKVTAPGPETPRDVSGGVAAASAEAIAGRRAGM